MTTQPDDSTRPPRRPKSPSFAAHQRCTRPTPGTDTAGRTPMGFSGLFASHRHRSSFAGVPLQLPAAKPVSPIGDIYCAVTTVDHRGRLGERSTINAMGWRPGQPITLSASPGLILADAATTSRWTIGVTGYLSLPAQLRRDSRITSSDRVLIVAAPERNLLVIYATAILAAALATTHPALWQVNP